MMGLAVDLSIEGAVDSVLVSLYTWGSKKRIGEEAGFGVKCWRVRGIKSIFSS